MWMFHVLLFLNVVLKNTGHMVTNLEYVVDVVTAVKSHYRSGCLSILHSPATEENVKVVFRLMNLLSHRGITAASPDVSHFNVTNDDVLCRHNHPLYILFQTTNELMTLANRTSLAGPTWLLFTNSSVELEKLLAYIYIPFNCEFLVAREELEGVFSIVEVYQVNRTQPLLSLQVATWSLKDGAKWNYRFLHERRQNLLGHTIDIITFDSPPLLTPVGVAKEMRILGIFGRMWSILEDQLNFTTEIRELFSNESAEVAIGQLKDGNADVVLGDITLTTERYLQVDFTVPISNNRLCTFIRRPASSYRALNNIVAPFSASLWFTVIGAVLVLTVCLYLAYRIGLNYGSSERPYLYTASQVILYMLGIFSQQGHHTTPVTWSCRIVYWVSYLTAVVLFSAYSGALVSSLANQRIVPPFTTFQGILKHGNYKVATLAESAHLVIFRDAREDLLRGLYEELFDIKNLPSTVVEGLQNVCNEPHYAFIVSSDNALALSRNISCTLMALQEASLPETLAFATSKNFPYLKLMNYKLMSLRRSGILNRIKSNELLNTFPTEKSLWISVSIEAVQPVFVILSIGIVVGVILVMLGNQARCLLSRSWLRIRR